MRVLTLHVANFFGWEGAGERVRHAGGRMDDVDGRPQAREEFCEGATPRAQRYVNLVSSHAILLTVFLNQPPFS